jgi:hypothetical protein
MVPLTGKGKPNPACPIPLEVKGFYFRQAIVDKFGHVLDGDWDEKGLNGCDHRDTPEWKAEHQKKVAHKKGPVKMETVTVQDTPTLETATVATVGVAKPIEVPPAQPEFGLVAAALVGAVSGAAVSSLMKLLKKKEPAPVPVPVPVKEKKESPSDCKAHHLKCGINQNHVAEELSRLDKRLLALETVEQSPVEFSMSRIEELAERIEKLEKPKKRAPAKKKL